MNEYGIFNRQPIVWVVPTSIASESVAHSFLTKVLCSKDSLFRVRSALPCVLDNNITLLIVSNMMPSRDGVKGYARCFGHDGLLSGFREQRLNWADTLPDHLTNLSCTVALSYRGRFDVGVGTSGALTRLG
jgi:hypothetical protein